MFGMSLLSHIPSKIGININRNVYMLRPHCRKRAVAATERFKRTVVEIISPLLAATTRLILTTGCQNARVTNLISRAALHYYLRLCIFIFLIAFRALSH
jgi:hypothetical protein